MLRANSTNCPPIQLPSSASTSSTTISLGTKESVGSRICVAAWNRLMANAVNSPASNTGAAISITSQSASRATPTIKKLRLPSEAPDQRADQQVPAVHRDEQQQLQGQRHQLRRQHDHAERGQHGGDNQVDD